MTDSSVNQTHNTLGVIDSDAEQLLHDLVAIPSPSHEESRAVEWLVHWMQAHDYDEAYIDDAGNAVGIMGRGTHDVMLLGHIDTFPGNPPMRREARLLYGRGTVDAKGSLCTFAVAAKRANIPDNIRLIVVGAVEEEAATSKGARYVSTQFAPQACIIGEPSQWDRITLGYKGRLLIDWSWEGALAHSAGLTASPAEHAVAYWRRVQQFAAQFNEDNPSPFQQLLPSLRSINSGQDGAFGWAEVTIGLRLPPGVAPNELAASLKTDESANIQVYGGEQAFVAEKDTNLSRALRAAIRMENGQPRFVFKTGTSDMNVVGPIWKCPIVAYGPGDAALDHTPDEHLDLDVYLKAIRVLISTLEKTKFGINEA